MKLNSKQAIDYFFGTALISAHGFVVRGLGLLCQRDHTLKKNPHCIVVTKMLGLGSLLMAADAIIAIKKQYAHSKLVLVCSSLIAKESKALGIFEEVWIVNDNSFFSLITSSIDAIFKSWKYKRLWTVNLEVYSKLTTIFALWTFAVNRFGFYVDKKKSLNALNTHYVHFDSMQLAYNNYEQMALKMNACVNEIYRFPMPENISGKLRYIAINNNCSELAKERVIPDDILIKTMLEISAISYLDFALIGAMPDHEYNEQLRNHSLLKPIQQRIINIAGKYDFLNFLYFLKKECALMLTIDSGPLHFAYRLNMPVVSVWGPTDPQTRIPITFQHETIYLKVICSPCVHHKGVLPCRGDNFCMKDMSPNQISDAIKSTLFFHYENGIALS